MKKRVPTLRQLYCLGAEILIRPLKLILIFLNQTYKYFNLFRVPLGFQTVLPATSVFCRES